MNIEQLSTFREVVRLGSFSEAARALGISQPAVSFQIQRLEQELGVRLLDRSQRTVTPTTAGKRVLEFAAGTQDNYEAMLKELEQLREDIAGDLVIAASTIPGEFILPSLLAAFKQQNPAVVISVDVMDSQQVIDSVLNGKYETGFCGIIPENRTLAAIPIASDEIILIVPSSHPLAKRSSITPEELYGEHFIAREPSSGTRRTLEQHLEKAGIDMRKLTPHLILGSTQAVVNGVAAGAGIAFVSSLAVGNQPAARGIRRLAVKGLDISRQFFCIYREGELNSRLLAAFVTFITSGETPEGK